MYFRRFYDERLAQASYLVGCQQNGTAIVLDPARVIAPYLEVAAAEGLRIVAVTETHIHADFVSGLRELAAATGARMYLSGCGPAAWQYGFRDDPAATILRDRDAVQLGNVRIEAVHTPGHTPEHLCFLVTDGAAATDPIGIVTGDFVFVGDVGRPDLLEKAAKVVGTAEAGARDLFRSLGWFKTLPDHLQVWPGHGAGSACGKGLGAMPQSTVGYERRYNWALGIATEEEFVRQVLVGQPDPPRYFGRMKRVNRDGPTILGSLPTPPRLDRAGLERALAAGETVVDGRTTGDFADGHVPGTINVPMNRSFPGYAGSLVAYDAPLHLIRPVGMPATDVVESLVSVGFDRIDSISDASVVAEWASVPGRSLGKVVGITAADWHRQRAASAFVVDVRNGSEWDDGHLAGAHHIPLPELVARLDEIPADRDIVVHCQGGGRSAIAASVLQAHGRNRVTNLLGGFGAWVVDGGAFER